jgi:hypothetical protein
MERALGARRRKSYKVTAVCLGGLVAIVLTIWVVLRLIPRPIVPPDPAWLPPKPVDRWECIVIHHSASDSGGAVRFDKIHREKNGWDGLGYDFVIGNGTDTPDGTVEVGFRWKQQKDGAHCKTPDEYYNKHGIGICLVGNFDNYDPTAAQMKSLETLCAFLTKRFHIAPDHVFTHGGVTHRTACPGKRFQLQIFRNQLIALSH